MQMVAERQREGEMRKTREREGEASYGTAN